MVPRQWLWDKTEGEPVQLVTIAFTEDAGVYNFHFKRPTKRAIQCVQFHKMGEIYSRFEELYMFDNRLCV